MTASLSILSPAATPASVSELRDAAPSYKYIPALDGIRAVSILTVVISHYGLADIVPGGLGVNIFFFVSGLLISRQLSVELAACGRVNFTKFYLRRIARLFPALIVMIPVGAGLYMAMGQPITIPEVLSAVFYYGNYFGYYAGYDQPSSQIPHPFIILWSLAVEEHFYLFFPLLISVLFRRGRLYLATLVAILIAVPLWRLHLHDLCSVDLAQHPLCGMVPAQRIYGGTDTRADALLYGVLLTEVLRHKSFHPILSAIGSPVGFCCGILLILTSLLIRNDEFRDVHRYTIQSIGMIPIVLSLVFTGHFSGLRQLLESKPAILIGRWSYSLYLYHWVAMSVGGGLNHTEFSLGWYATTVPLCLSLCLISYYVVEMPVVGLRRRLGSHVTTTTATAPGTP